MTEKSFFWGGEVTGDAIYAPYDDAEFTTYMHDLGAISRARQGICLTIDNGLAITNPASTTIRVASGKALVEGKIYGTDANVDVSLSAAPGAGTDYYTLVLRKAFAAQTVRVVLLGPVNGGPAPDPTQVADTTWELILATITHTSAGVITIYDRRVPLLMGGALWREEGGDFAAITKTIEDVPAGYKQLRLEILMRGDLAGAGSHGVDIRFNGDTGNNYSDHSWVFRDTTVSSVTTSAARDSIRIGGFLYEGADALMFHAIIHITQDGLGYASVDWTASMGDTSFMVFARGNGTWQDSSEITDITIFETTEVANIDTDFYRITLYGVP